MSLNGVWALEVAGVYGWERVSTAFLEKGRYLGGNANFFSQGSYTSKGKNIHMSLDVVRHGARIIIFGEKQKQFTVEFVGKKKNNIIKGYISLKGAHSSIARYPTQFIKLADID
ncbi:MAG: hypothetical protein GY694_02085 [Gammaproteobacteria bacterium]|nr:hypothetical protein [Gammaproteobacteria bacterium]